MLFIEKEAAVEVIGFNIESWKTKPYFNLLKTLSVMRYIWGDFDEDSALLGLLVTLALVLGD